MPYELEPPQGKAIVATVLTILGVLVVGAFALRVAHFAGLIRSGEIKPSDVAFLSRYPPSMLARAIPFDAAKAASVDSPDDPSLGGTAATLTIVEFADFGCPYSRESSAVMRAASAKYSDRIRYVYRDFPIVELHPDAIVASLAAECAHQQGKFWEYHDKVYLSDDLSEARLKAVAREVNLDEGAFDACLMGNRTQSELEEDYKAGLDAGVRGTPTFFLHGTMIPGSIPEDILIRLIDRALAS